MKQTIDNTPQPKGKIIIPIINYTLIYLLAGFLNYLIFQLASIYVGSYLCEMPLKWTSYIVEARIPEAAWDMYRVTRFFTYPSYLSLVIAIIFSFLFLKQYHKKGLLKIFYLWMAFHAFNLFAGHIIIGLITKEGFYYPLLWKRASDLIIILIGVLSVAFLVVFGCFYTRAVFLIAFSRSFVENYQKRNMYLLKLFVIPWIIGSILLIAVKLDYHNLKCYLISLNCILLIAVKLDFNYFYEFPQFEWLINFPIGLILLPMFFLNKNYRKSDFVIIKDKRPTKINIKLILFIGFVILAYKIFLINGISI